MNVARLTDDGELEWYCPGCKRNHHVPVVGGRGWKWNQSLEKPTLEPSVKILPSLVHALCHCAVTEGRLNFLTDCSHGLAATIHQMEPLP